jgi:hypothetical protein
MALFYSTPQDWRLARGAASPFRFSELAATFDKFFGEAAARARPRPIGTIYNQIVAELPHLSGVAAMASQQSSVISRVARRGR